MNNSIYVLWDASHIWGLMALHTLRGLHIPHHIVTCNEIIHGKLDNKPNLLLVPGGTASLKYQALGEKGVNAIREYIKNGGNYLGFCGGAGLGLSHEHGLGLCPWTRAKYTDRMQHLVSGHVISQMHAHELSCKKCTDVISLPIWWPSRFAAQKNTDVSILATYTAPGHDLYFADIDLTKLPPSTLEQWQDVYGVNMHADFLQGQPCIIAGNYGQGQYVLSYSHLETPQSPQANTWLIELLQSLTKLSIFFSSISPAWDLENMPQRWDRNQNTEMLFFARDSIKQLLNLGVEHNLFFKRTSWLYGWRTGLPGGSLNNLYTVLCTILSQEPTANALYYWQDKKQEFSNYLKTFIQGTQDYLLAERLATTLAVPMPNTINRQMLKQQQEMLFGSVMHCGGLHKELLTTADNLLYLLMKS